MPTGIKENHIQKKQKEIMYRIAKSKCCNAIKVKKGIELKDKDGFIYGAKFYQVCSKCGVK
jgi:hypothetical protein